MPSLWSETTFTRVAYSIKKNKKKTLLLEKGLAELSIQYLRKMVQYSLHLRVAQSFQLQHKEACNMNHIQIHATYATVTFSVDHFHCLSVCWVKTGRNYRWSRAHGKTWAQYTNVIVQHHKFQCIFTASCYCCILFFISSLYYTVWYTTYIQ